MTCRRLALLLAACLAAGPLTAVPVHAAARAKPGDLNGDGRVDLVVGAPRAKAAGKKNAGLVVIRYAGGKGRQVLTGKNGFGSRLASADFDGDGFADLAVAGRASRDVVLRFGSKKGLSARTVRIRTQGQDPVLAAGDFNADGRADLAAAGNHYVEVFDSGGTVRSRLLDPSVLFEWAVGGEDERLGPVAADFTGDGVDDLAVTQLYVCQGPDCDGPGVLTLSKGSKSGLGTPVKAGEDGNARAYASGDLNKDGRADLAVAYANQSFDSGPDPYGGFRIYSGTGSGFKRTFQRDPLDGDAVAIGDVNRDGRPDTVVGSPEAKIGKARGAGRITILFGGGRTVRFDENSKGVPGTARRGDGFGGAVTFADVTGDGRPELVIGAAQDGGADGRLYFYDGKRFRTLTAKALGLSGRNAHLGEIFLTK